MKHGYIRRLLVLSFALILSLTLFVLPTSAATGSASIGLSSRSVYIGNTVYVTVTYSSSTPMATWSFGVSYDASRLQYVSGAHSTTGGTLNFVDQPTSGGVTSKSYTIAFKTIALGEAKVSTITREVYAEDYSTITVPNASRTISIVEPPEASKENRLSALSGEGITLSPEFHADTTEYTASVEYATANVTVNATPKDGAASVTVRGNEALAVGDNTVQITVRAENGDTKTYTITVTRKDSVYAAANTVIGDKTLEFPRDVSEVKKVPDGFLPVTSKFGGKDVLTFINETSSVPLAILLEKTTDDQGNVSVTEHHFLFDEATQTFTPYLTKTTDPVTYVFLPLPEGMDVPAGIATTLALEKGSVIAWTVTEEVGAASVEKTVVYAAPITGEAAFYVFDAEKGTFELYKKAEVPVNDEGKTFEQLEGEISALEGEKEAQKKQLYYLFVAAAGLLLIVLILIIVLIVVASRRRGKKEDDDTPLFFHENAHDDVRSVFATPIPVAAPEEDIKEEEAAAEEPFVDTPVPLVVAEEEEKALNSYVFAPIPAVDQPEEAVEMPAEETNKETVSDDFSAQDEADDLPAFEHVPVVTEVTSEPSPEPRAEEPIARVFVPFEPDESFDDAKPGVTEEQEDVEILAPVRPSVRRAARDIARPAPKAESEPEVAQEEEPRRGHPEAEAVFGSNHADLYGENNPIIDEEEEEGGDAPVYGFDE